MGSASHPSLYIQISVWQGAELLFGRSHHRCRLEPGILHFNVFLDGIGFADP